MNDTIDDVMGDEEDEEESDAAVFQVQDELGLNLTDELSKLPSNGGSVWLQVGKISRSCNLCPGICRR